jgi:hypothetical protein
VKKLLLIAMSFLLLTGQVFAQGETVERLYFVDALVSGNVRYAAHFGEIRYGIQPDPELVGVPLGRMDYGLINQMLVAATVDAAQQAYLDGLPDVLVIPLDLETTVTAGNRNAIRNALRNRNIPSSWVNTGDTYRVVLREIAGYFQFMQRLTAITQLNPLTAGITLDTQYQELAAVMAGCHSSSRQRTWLRCQRVNGYNHR